MQELKQVIVMRKDLNMRKGKMIAQGAHASATIVFKATVVPSTHWLDRVVAWMNAGQRKISVSVDSEQELLEIFQQAQEDGLMAELITDAGHTEFNGVPTKTCCAIGPGPASKIDKITGHLKLL
jgi:PTH2 family peptidyl-tRNA hydrolase